jgi:uncharacterized protein YodC (DUF2158 family)
MAFNVGQVVKLKSGGPKMTVVVISDTRGGSYQTSWFAGSKNETAWFPEQALEEAIDEPKKE